MVDFLNHLFAQVTPLWGYIILFASAIVENLFPPIPGDTVTVLGAYLITTGRLGFWGVYFSTTLGSVIGFYIMFLIGRRFGLSFIQSPKRGKYFSPRRVEKVQKWFDSYGYWVIAANRFLSGTRSVVSLFAGIFRLNSAYVLLLSLLSALVWNGLLIYGGYQLGMNMDRITAIISQYNKIVIALTVLLIIYFVIKKMRKKSANDEVGAEE